MNSQNKFMTGCLSAILTVLALLCLVLGLATNETALWVLAIIILAGETIWLVVASRRRASRRTDDSEATTQIWQLISAIRQGYVPELQYSPVLLSPEEKAHLVIAALRLITKNKAVGRRSSGAGMRMRVAPGLSVGNYGGRSQTIYGEVTESYRGQLVVTSKRIVFLHPQHGFECSLNKITAIYPVDQGRISIQLNKGVYELGVMSSELIQALIQAILSKQ